MTAAGKASQFAILRPALSGDSERAAYAGIAADAWVSRTRPPAPPHIASASASAS